MCPWVGPHAPSFWGAALGAAEPCGVSLTTGNIAPASLRYNRLTPVARVAGARCLAGDPLLDCVPARLSPIASRMQPGWARTSGFGVPPLLLARWVGWVAPVRPTSRVWFVVARPFVALGAHVCTVSWAT